MLPDLTEELQQLCEYLQQDVSDGAAGLVTGDAAQTESGSANYIPTVVGATAERVEPVRDTVNCSDHLYHKVIEPTVVTTVLNNNTKRVDIVNSTRVLHKVVSASVNDSSISLASPKSESMFADDSDCGFDIGSDGNRSPYSDISSSLSPGTPHDDLGLDWNDSFVDLFPQLSA